jgi:hypothetical protein
MDGNGTERQDKCQLTNVHRARTFLSNTQTQGESEMESRYALDLQTKYATPARVAYVMSATDCDEDTAVASLIAEQGDEEDAILDVRCI